MNEKMEKLTEMLQKGVEEYFKSDTYKILLNTLAKFHNYSYGNCILIAQQMPTASYVAGYQSWKHNFHRQVKKHERSIRIISPTKYKTKDDDGNEVERQGFKAASVFDISQTEQIPDMDIVPIGIPELTGDIENYTGLITACTLISPVNIMYDSIAGGVKGYFSDSEQKIVINTGMSQKHTAHTILHEICHAKIHNHEIMKDAKKDRHTMETEAESVSYICSKYFGFDTSEYSFPYIASWSSGKEHEQLLRSSMITIQKTADEIIKAIEEEMRNMI